MSLRDIFYVGGYPKANNKGTDNDFKILMKLNDEDMLLAIKNYSNFYKFKDDEVFWKARYMKKYGNDMKPYGLSWKESYLMDIMKQDGSK